MPQYQPRVTALPQVTFIDAVKTCLRKYCDPKGRARRSEYWWFVLFNVLASSAATFLLSIAASLVQMPMLPIIGSFAVWLLLLLPQYSVLARRLHDTGHGGWWAAVFALGMLLYYVSYFVVMLPIMNDMASTDSMFQMLGAMADAYSNAPVAAAIMACSSLVVMVFGLITLIFSLMDSKVEANKYGPSPKYICQ